MKKKIRRALTRLRYLLRKLRYVIYGVIVALTLCLVGGYLYLVSDSFSNWLIPKVLATVKEKTGLDVSYAQMSFDPFSHLTVEQVKTDLSVLENIEGGLLVKELGVRFSFWSLLVKEIEVKEVFVKNPVVTLEVEVGETPPPENDPEASSMQPFLLIEKTFKELPITFELNKFFIEGAQVDLKLSAPEQEVALDLKGFTFEAQVRADRSGLALTYSLNHDPSSLLTLHNTGAGMRLQSQFHINAEGGLNFLVGDADWILRLQENNLSLGLVDSRLSVKDEQNKFMLSLGKLQAGSKIEGFSASLNDLRALKDVSVDELSEQIVPATFAMVKSLTYSQDIDVLIANLNVKAPRLSKHSFSSALNHKSKLNISLEEEKLKLHIVENQLSLGETSLKLNQSQVRARFASLKMANALKAQVSLKAVENIDDLTVSHLEVSLNRLDLNNKIDNLNLSVAKQDLQVSLNHSLNLGIREARVSREEEWQGIINSAYVNQLGLTYQLNNFSLRQGKNSVRLGQLDVKKELALKDRQLKGRLETSLRRLSLIPQLKAIKSGVVPGIKLSYGVGLDLKQPTLDLKANIFNRKKELFAFSLDQKVKGKLSETALKATLVNTAFFKEVFKNIEFMKETGDFKIHVDLKNRSRMQRPFNINTVKYTKPAEVFSKGQLKISAEQLKKARRQKLLGLNFHRQPIDISVFYSGTGSQQGNKRLRVEVNSKKLSSVHANLAQLAFNLDALYNEGRFDLALGTQLEGVQHPQILKPVTLKLDSQTQGHIKKRKVKSKINAYLGKKQILGLNASLKDKNGTLNTWGALAFSLPTALHSLHSSLKDLKVIGEVDGLVRWKANLEHHKKGIEKYPFDRHNIPNMKSNISLKLLQKRPGKPTLKVPYTVVFTKPIHTKIDATIKNKFASFNLVNSFQDLRVPKEAKLLGFKQSAQGSVHLSRPKETVFLDYQMQLARSLVEKDIPQKEEVNSLLKNIRVSLKAKTKPGELAVVDGLSINVGGQALTVKLSGQSDFKADDVTLQGSVVTNLQGHFGAKGKLVLPWLAVKEGGESIRLEGLAQFRNFHYMNPKIQLELMDFKGTIPFTQEFQLLEGGQVRWTYLNNENPFKRVDAVKMTPYLGEVRPLRLRKLRFKDKEVGPLIANVNLEQNLFHLDRLDLQLYKGIIVGRSFINIHPKNITVGLMGRATGLQPSLMTQKGGQGDGSRLSARLAAFFNLNESLLEGRVDVNEIGKNQLLALLDVLDPHGEDDNMNSARLGLRVAYPKYVGMNFSQGLMDMKIDLDGAVSKDIEVQRFPISSFINSQTADLKKILLEVPVQ